MKVRLLAGVALVAAVVAGSILVVRLVGDSEPSGPTISFALDDLMNLGGRDELRICVDGAGTATAGPLRVEFVSQALRAALEQTERQRIPPEYFKARTTLRCPEPLVLAGKIAAYSDRGDELGSRLVGNPSEPRPSEYMVRVYFVDLHTYRARFGELRFTNSYDEHACAGDWCQSVTMSLYFPDDAPAQTVTFGLMAMLNLLNREQVQQYNHEQLDRPRD